MKILPTPIEESYSVEYNESINSTTQTKLVVPFHRTTVGLSSLSYQTFILSDPCTLSK